MDIRDKIQAGEYRTDRVYPLAVSRPALFSKTAGRMTEEEVNSLLDIRRKYEQDCKERERQVSAYNVAVADANRRFYLDLCVAYGVDHRHRFIQRMYTIAWEKGHSAGLGDVVSEFEELMSLWNIAKEMGA